MLGSLTLEHARAVFMHQNKANMTSLVKISRIFFKNKRTQVTECMVSGVSSVTLQCPGDLVLGGHILPGPDPSPPPSSHHPPATLHLHNSLDLQSIIQLDH